MASPSHFFDPFRTPPSVIKAPNSPGKTPMLVGGLGTISAKSNAKESIKFIVHSSDPSTQPTLTLDITGASCVLSKRDNDSVPYQKVADYKFPKGEASAYLNVASKKDPTVYWISVDRSNGRFRYNVLPVTVDLPPLVVTDQQISLEALESYSHTTIANLPATCQTLYHNVAGPNITVESPTFPQLPEAIEQSLKDPNKVCGKMLAEKKKLEPWITDKELYLRITVGDNLANSPGIPYVMEIWPPGHESPIHDHGEASAVIKVLYGNIDCTWYDDLQEGVVPKPLGPAIQLTKGNVTWLGKKQFQVHKLQNNYKTVCITLQCYQFDADDTVHNEHFDMLTNEGKKVAWTPTSDLALYMAIENAWQRALDEAPGLIYKKFYTSTRDGGDMDTLRSLTTDNGQNRVQLIPTVQGAATASLGLSRMSSTREATYGSSINPNQRTDKAITTFEVVKKTPSLPCFSKQVHKRKSDFFGRQDVLDLIDETLLPDQQEGIDAGPSSVRSFALCGMGGIGKTEMAVEYA
ncbi:hypothetical protein MY3296_006462 [Beauveria thailandica]